MKTHYTAKELAGLPDMPSTERAVKMRADRENWSWQKRAGRGGGREYALASLPRETQEYLKHRHLDALAANLPALCEAAPAPAINAKHLPAPATLKQWQRDCMDARMCFIRLIEAAAPHVGVKKAMAALEKRAVNGDFPPEVAAIIPLANARSGNSRALSARTMLRWWVDYNHAGKNAVALAPKDTETFAAPLWAPWFEQLYCVPQKPSARIMEEKLAKLVPAHIPAPSYDQIRRYIAKRSVVELAKGRHTGAELKQFKAYTLRDTSTLLPMQVCLCDGHSFKSYVAHPKHGRPFKPELCAVMCAATRRVEGWSAGLAESSQTVADAFHNAIENSGMITIAYTDKGAGNCADLNAAPEMGRFWRLGITHETGRAGNPQGRGMIERLNKSLWIPFAKDLPTYMGKDMDKGAARQIYLTLQKDVREAKKRGEKPQSEMLPGWFDFLDVIPLAVDDYNNRPHSELPKFRDPTTGRIRNMSPNEMKARFVLDGWQPDMLPADQLADLFRPRQEKITTRGMVSLFGNKYFLKDLEHYHGRTVIVEYAVQDGSQVWVRDREHQRLIGVAKFEGNKRSFFAKSAIDQAEEERANRREALKLEQIEEIRAERDGVREAIVIEHSDELQEKRASLTATPSEDAVIMDRPRAKLLQLHEPEPVPEGFRVPDDRQERLDLWQEINRRFEVADESLTDEELRWLVAFKNSPVWKAWARIHLSAVK